MIQSCTRCGAKLRHYFLKDGVCNGCRNPQLVVVARQQGKVLWWDARDGNGVIVGDDGNEYYTDDSATVGRISLKRGQGVTFEHNTAIVHCLCATGVAVNEAR